MPEIDTISKREEQFDIVLGLVNEIIGKLMIVYVNLNIRFTAVSFENK
jgi:hypothetical protein